MGDFERHLDRVPPAPRGRAWSRCSAARSATSRPAAGAACCATIAALLGPDDHLLLGTDLVKDPAVLEAAYDDAAGVTAEFNRNVLHVINRELDADFEPERFDHVAFFDREHEWIEMRLRAQRECTVRVGALDLDVEFAAGEELRTEITAKFTRERLERDYAAAGLELAQWYSDGAEQFAVTLADRRGRRRAGGCRHTNGLPPWRPIEPVGADSQRVQPRGRP